MACSCATALSTGVCWHVLACATALSTAGMQLGELLVSMWLVTRRVCAAGIDLARSVQPLSSRPRHTHHTLMVVVTQCKTRCCSSQYTWLNRRRRKASTHTIRRGYKSRHRNRRMQARDAVSTHATRARARQTQAACSNERLATDASTPYTGSVTEVKA